MSTLGGLRSPEQSVLDLGAPIGASTSSLSRVHYTAGHDASQLGPGPGPGQGPSIGRTVSSEGLRTSAPPPSGLRSTAPPPLAGSNGSQTFSAEHTPQTALTIGHDQNTGVPSGSGEHRPSNASGSGGDHQSDSDQTANEELRHQRSKELRSPSEATLSRAAMIATSAGGAGVGAAGAAALVHGHNHHQGNGTRPEPRGWQDVKMDDKYSLWAGDLKKERKGAFSKAALIFLFLSLWMWATLSIFWGSTYHLTNHFSNLTVHLIPFDNDAASFLVGPMVNEANYENSLPTSVPHFTWIIRSPNDYPNGLADVREEIIGQKCWAAVVINANATSAWRTALSSGDASYDPNGAVGIYFQSARFYQVVLLYIQATIIKTLQNPLSSARGAAFKSFLSTSSGNTNALTSAAQVPQALGTGFGYTIQDLRPIGNYQWGAAAPMEAALIYFVIFSFINVMMQAQARMQSGLQKKLKFKSILGLRLGWPIMVFFFISLWFTCIEAAWQVPLTNVIGRAGFPALWALNFLTIIAAGLALETVQALIGVEGLPPFLILWIILNITSSFYPIEMMDRFYRFLYWLPFHNNIEAYKIIAFGTNHTHVLGKYYGIILGMIGVELIIFPLAIWFERWRTDRSAKKEQRLKREKEQERAEQGGE